MGYRWYVCNHTFNRINSKIHVGALWSNVTGTKRHWKFHDVSLGDHIENAYHAIALGEHRKDFNCVLWESPKARRPVQTFEQCYMAGDHSNVGGSWPEQQLADISLAWMMSRFAALGVKFDDTYLWQEYLKCKNYAKVQGPKITSANGGPYTSEFIPRQWGEGGHNSRVSLTSLLMVMIRSNAR